MEVFDETTPTIGESSNTSREDWGNDYVVFADEEETGQWIMFDPEDDEVELDDWR